MSRFAVLAIRFVMIVIGFCAAAFVASAFFVVLTAGSAGIELGEPEEMERIGLIVATGLGALFIGYYSFLPAMVVVVIGEIFGSRDWLFYAVGGGCVAVAGVTIFLSSGGQSENQTSMFALAATAGVCGGVTYWLVAGRGAGSWHLPRDADNSTSNPSAES
ncbi:MAG: hypothetical protein AB3N20_00855 [Rhizobiaceae bacterium]